MQQLDTYLLFDGQCEEAFKFYAQVLGGKIEGMMTFEGSPAAAQVPAGAEWGKRILHARQPNLRPSGFFKRHQRRRQTLVSRLILPGSFSMTILSRRFCLRPSISIFSSG